MSVEVVLCALGAGSGILLLIAGLRGRRIDTHPVCRKCRFDLIGVYDPAAPRPALKCPECGVSLDRRRPTRTGNRRKRRWALVAGAGLILPVLAIAAMAAASAVSGPGANQRKPVWMLSLEARYAGHEWSAAALTELTRRVDKQKLPESTARSLARTALARQADPSRAWLPEWGDFLWAARFAGFVDRDQTERFLRQAASVDLSVHRRARAGEPIPVALHIRIPRGTSHGLPVPVTFQFDRTIADGRLTLAPQTGPDSALTLSQSISGRGEALGTTTRARPGPVPVGPIPWSCRWIATVPAMSLGYPTLVQWADQKEGAITIVSPDQDVIDLIRDPALTEQMRAAITPFEISLWTSTSAITLKLTCANLPAPVDFTVVLRWKDGHGDTCEFIRPALIVLPAGTYGSHSYSIDVDQFPPADVGTMEVVLRSSIPDAERDAEVATMWAGPDLVYPSVPVVYIRQGLQVR